jgi:hypothetical protein
MCERFLTLPCFGFRRNSLSLRAHAKTVQDPVFPGSCDDLDSLAASWQLPCIHVLLSLVLHAHFRTDRRKTLTEIAPAFLKTLASLIETRLGASREKHSYRAHNQ